MARLLENKNAIVYGAGGGIGGGVARTFAGREPESSWLAGPDRRSTRSPRTSRPRAVSRRSRRSTRSTRGPSRSTPGKQPPRPAAWTFPSISSHGVTSSRFPWST